MLLPCYGQGHRCKEDEIAGTLALMGESEHLNRMREPYEITGRKCKNDIKLYHKED
jgi:hypothetical protein